MMLMKDAPAFQRDLYKVEYEKLTGKKKTVYYSAMQELKDKGYLRQKQGTIWEFYPEIQSDFSDS